MNDQLTTLLWVLLCISGFVLLVYIIGVATYTLAGVPAKITAAKDAGEPVLSEDNCNTGVKV